MSSKKEKSLPRRSLRNKPSAPLAEGPASAPPQPAPPVLSSVLKLSTSQPHCEPPEAGPSTTGTRPRKRKKGPPPPTSSAGGHETPELHEDIPSRLENSGVSVGPKATRNRLLDLLDKYVDTKRPRLVRNNQAPRIRSSHEVRSKRRQNLELNTTEPSPARNQDTRKESLAADPAPPEDYDFNILECPDLIQIVEKIGFDGRRLTKDKLVDLCNKHRDKTRIPRHQFRFEVQALQTSSPPPTGPEGKVFLNIVIGGSIKLIKLLSAHADVGLSSLMQCSTPTGQSLPPNISSVGQAKSPISKKRSKGKERARSSSPTQSSERSTTAQPADLSQFLQPTEDVLNEELPSLEHRRFRHPRPNPTHKLVLSSKTNPTESSDDDWHPPDDDKSSSDSDAGDRSEESNSDKQSPSPKSTKKTPAMSHVSPPQSSMHAQSPPSPHVGQSDAPGQGACEEEQNEPEWRTKYYQLKHSLAETNSKLEIVTHDLNVLSEVVSRISDVKPSSSPETKTRGGRSAYWMRIHVDTLLGLINSAASLPPPATEEEQEAWQIEIDLDNFDPCTEATPSTSDPSLPESDGLKHPKATTQQLIVMRTMLRFVGVSRFCPNFANSPSSAENKWLWDLAFRIFIKIVECGEYPGVSLDAKNRKYLKKLLDTRVRSLVKRYQQEAWTEVRKKRAASAVRRRARLAYTKKLRDRIVLSQRPLWPLSAVIQEACSDDETDHEDCAHPDNIQSRTPCHIRKPTWRSSELTNIFILLDEYKARLDVSIPKPRKQENQSSGSTHGRPPRPRLRCPNGLISDIPVPSGLPVDCYSPDYLDSLTPFERSALEIDRKPLLSNLIPIVESLQ
ncbi:uncharacterized protein MELLADRAFT_60049 [Melampsora larici-populina 98AG31]|uniref:Uncharacterized protein n=1 Tax=Melampsora larici-populina (strain 98AG31 / pathotype 3-4-7) TaxID=747676 RepID=F4R8K0_MELLP|nr:uncharacterized protein MELLADRAFT_60049 [Melampsora larici-populina 98AG31]EGG11099.1 hypothetical protein MELLADRAFT_60049 [Melampsora larici-populina 98AG31]